MIGQFVLGFVEFRPSQPFEPLDLV